MLVAVVFTSIIAVQDFLLLPLLKACLTPLVPQKLVLREALIQITSSFEILGSRHSEQSSVYILHHNLVLLISGTNGQISDTCHVGSRAAVPVDSRHSRTPSQ